MKISSKAKYQVSKLTKTCSNASFYFSTYSVMSLAPLPGLFYFDRLHSEITQFHGFTMPMLQSIFVMARKRTLSVRPMHASLFEKLT